MILGFKDQFQPKIEVGTKIQTIRRDKHNRWKEGCKIHFTTGVRTEEQNTFAEGVCKSTQNFRVSYTLTIGGKKHVRVFIDDRLFSTTVWYGNETATTNHSIGFSMFDFAKNDGFNSIDDFFEWFSEDFEGKIIHWTDKRY